MKKLLFILFLLLSSAGCAKAIPVTLVWDYSRFNANPGFCTVSADTCKDLARYELFAQRSGRSDSLLVASRNVPGMEGRADSTIVDQPEGTTFYWLYVFDITGNRSCRITTSKTIILSPASPIFK